MPKEGKRPEWEKLENRKKIFLELLKRPSSFTELLENLPISRGALAKHLKELEEEKIIEKTRRKGKRVYQIAFDNENRIINELKSIHFDLLLESFAELVDPLIIDLWKSYLESLYKGIFFFKKRELMDEPRMSAKELHIKSYEIIQSSAPPKAKKIMRIDEIVEKLKKMPDSNFEEFEKLRRSMDKELKEGKKNEGKD